MVRLVPIGYVHSTYDGKPEPESRASIVSEIEVCKEYEDGLTGIESHEFLVIVYGFHAIHEWKLRVHPRGDAARPLTGVFSTRSQLRPNPIGISVVRLQERKGDTLTVQGLDAMDGSPVFDIKPYSDIFDTDRLLREA
ncbi:MAG TPA: tRNA (N6-threonylcarbamoyladenosine(37)-N6)-methyltransferase TrmO [Candidatus Methanoperedenaceae archaeon]|nr:tRNA (N6-threonylcarbamoyladenosine(37)-N6)-methyltransferase TrmO [Candidatus Methanoperedenaceae archaeon]